MDLSATLNQLTRKLCKPTLETCQVHIRKAFGIENNYRVVIDGKSAGESVQGGGISKSLLTAYAKALGEFGEGLVCLRENHDNRSGMAAGLLFFQAVDRAKAELIERDAFLHHYRNEVPFLGRRPLQRAKSRSFIAPVAFRMATAHPDWHSFLVTDDLCATGQRTCLLFGTAADRNEKLALQRAHDEYQVIAHVHNIRPSRCAELAGDSSSSSSADRHHLSSRDSRNLERFRTLCSPMRATKGGRQSIHNQWEIERLQSPIETMVYARVRHRELTPLVFDIPEAVAGNTPLYHPFW